MTRHDDEGARNLRDAQAVARLTEGLKAQRIDRATAVRQLAEETGMAPAAAEGVLRGWESCQPGERPELARIPSIWIEDPCEIEIEPYISTRDSEEDR
jgi:hypothetical protein